MNATIECLDVVRPEPAVLNAARRLYESTLHPCERIPWSWIERTIWAKATGMTSSWNRHLLIAADKNNPSDVYGYLVATYFSGHGGYVSYMGVDDRARGRGIGTLLYETALDVLRRDAELVDETLPFVIWESLVPNAADEHERTIWQARAKLFDRVGAFWVEGIELWTPDYEVDYDSVPYQLFVRPVAESASSFTPGRLRKVVHDHYRRVYKKRPGDEHYERTFAVHPKPKLRPAAHAKVCLGQFA